MVVLSLPARYVAQLHDTGECVASSEGLWCGTFSFAGKTATVVVIHMLQVVLWHSGRSILMQRLALGDVKAKEDPDFNGVFGDFASLNSAMRGALARCRFPAAHNRLRDWLKWAAVQAICRMMSRLLDYPDALRLRAYEAYNICCRRIWHVGNTCIWPSRKLTVMSSF